MCTLLRRPAKDFPERERRSSAPSLGWAVDLYLSVTSDETRPRRPPWPALPKVSLAALPISNLKAEEPQDREGVAAEPRVVWNLPPPPVEDRGVGSSARASLRRWRGGDGAAPCLPISKTRRGAPPSSVPGLGVNFYLKPT